MENSKRSQPRSSRSVSILGPRVRELRFKDEDKIVTAPLAARHIMVFPLAITITHEEGKAFYRSGNFRSSILSFTQAIKKCNSASKGSLIHDYSDTMALLLSDRAQSHLMIRACKAAVADCLLALMNVTMPRAKEPFFNDRGFLLKIKLCTTLARGYLQLGNNIEATAAFARVIATADEALAFSQANHLPHVYQQHQSTIKTMATEATLGQWDAIVALARYFGHP